MTTTQHPPSSNRFSARHIWNAHMKGLKNRDYGSRDPRGVPDFAGRAVLYGLPLILGALAVWRGVVIHAVDGLLAASGVLGGALFMAFTQVAAWRDRYTQRLAERAASELPQRYSLDETVAHILMATYACFLLLVIVLVGANFADKNGYLVGVSSGASITVGSYLLLLIMIILPKLYTAYAVTHEVDDEMSGLQH